ncbi:MAG: GNAT family N-acetyltransferase [Ignavibacteria bacterium]|jgi:GNAT superfamily N-acetyltransferase
MSAVEPVTNASFEEFFALVCALADYEKLERPSSQAKQRLADDITGPNPRIDAFLLRQEHGLAVGYAIVLETYSSFLALPTLYLEDIFVLEEHRGTGLGSKLFDHVVALARSRGCGRVDWQVLDWNAPAREFYERKGAECMSQWLLCRITL